MFALPNFCRVCLKYDKNLIDLEHLENEPGETLLSKLEQCVSEVEWLNLKPILCHPCIKRLNAAFTFKKQCIRTVTALKSYMTLLQQNMENVSQPVEKNDNNPTPNSYIKIILPPIPTGQELENVFLNLPPLHSAPESKDSNQNLLNMVQRLLPNENKSVNELLTESKSEELSIEIDPTDFEMSECGSTPNEEGANPSADWDDIISSSHVSTDKKKDASYPTSNFVPILPKQTSDEKINEFMSFGQHFLSPSAEIRCATCQKEYPSITRLKSHIEYFHAGKYPFKCEFCSTEFLFKDAYENCQRSHQNKQAEVVKSVRPFLPQPKARKKYFIKGKKNARCDVCNRDFSTQSYLQLHKKLHLRDNAGYKLKVFGKQFYSKSPQQSQGDDNRNKK